MRIHVHIITFILLSYSFSSQTYAKKVHRLGAGDILQLSSPTHASLQQKLLIDDRGYIHIPSFGALKIAGLYPREAARRIRRKLAPFYNSLRIVKILRVVRKKFVWIRGWVKTPGRYHLRWKEQLEVLVAKAGGLKEGARLDSVWYQVPGKAPKRLNMLGYYLSKKLPIPYDLERNSVIFVSVKGTLPPEVGAKDISFTKGSLKISVFGAAKTPGIYPCFYPMNILQAISVAGGTVKDAGIHEILYTTKSGNLRWFDLRKYFTSKQTKLPMISPGAVIFVPFKAYGVSKRGSLHVYGDVAKPGIWRGRKIKNFDEAISLAGGIKPTADMESVVTVFRSSNFTISQTVNIKKAYRLGRLDRLPPTPQGDIVVHVKAFKDNPIIKRSNDLLQLVITSLSVITGITTIVVFYTSTQP